MQTTLLYPPISKFIMIQKGLWGYRLTYILSQLLDLFFGIATCSFQKYAKTKEDKNSSFVVFLLKHFFGSPFPIHMYFNKKKM